MEWESGEGGGAEREAGEWIGLGWGRNAAIGFQCFMYTKKIPVSLGHYEARALEEEEPQEVSDVD